MRRFRVWISGDVLSLRDQRRETYDNVELPSIRVVGESINQNGPYCEDWHLCLCQECEWLEIPVEALGFEEALLQLAQRLGFTPRLKLVNSTDFASRVLWPSELADKPLFEYRTKWWKLTTEQEYSAAVTRFLGVGGGGVHDHPTRNECSL